MAGSGLAIVMFTDLVGSTLMRERLGDDVADEIGVEHDRIIGDALASTDGRLVKNLGDGALIVFDSSVDAVVVGQHIKIRCTFGADGHVTPRGILHAGSKGGNDLPKGFYLRFQFDNPFLQGLHVFPDPMRACKMCDRIDGHTGLSSKIQPKEIEIYHTWNAKTRKTWNPLKNKANPA
jgi:hypothetical protein